MESDTPLRVLGLVGSLRAGSLNRGLMDAAREMAPELGMEITVFERLREIPPYDGDVEAQGDPDAVGELKAAVRAADALLIASPEYNYSVPGVLKNAVDWVSRPPPETPLRGKPAAILGASTGMSGTMRMQHHLRQVLAATQTLVMVAPEVVIPRAAERFVDGRLADESTRELLRKQLSALRAWTLTVGRRA
jgi:chromate reductase